MSKKYTIKKDDLVKYSQRTMKFLSFADDWYENIPSEVPDDILLVLNVLENKTVKTYNSSTGEVKDFYDFDLEKI